MEPDLPFVGMAKEVQRLSVAFAAGDPLLLPGPRKSGKTRLIQEALSGNRHVLNIAGEPLDGIAGAGLATVRGRRRIQVFNRGPSLGVMGT